MKRNTLFVLNLLEKPIEQVKKSHWKSSEQAGNSANKWSLLTQHLQVKNNSNAWIDTIRVDD